ncbi:MAG: hypothetical protein M1825_000635 [Sarcosagium campestre]|nr:MAG: hypothetical protein M1825_000635 [Sarcosagium campestre]
MAPAVQASSLSELTTLAFNPPRYPRNPTQEVREPLVLYIAKVPGSRDVFLTTMKPREKVVTAQDVSSSLYYLHVDQPEDETLLDDLQGVGDETRTKDDQKPPSGIHRKPLPLVPTDAIRERKPHAKTYSFQQFPAFGRSSMPQPLGVGEGSSSSAILTSRAVNRKPVENSQLAPFNRRSQEVSSGKPTQDHSGERKARRNSNRIENILPRDWHLLRNGSTAVVQSGPPLPPRQPELPPRPPLHGGFGLVSERARDWNPSSPRFTSHEVDMASKEVMQQDDSNTFGPGFSSGSSNSYREQGGTSDLAYSANEGQREERCPFSVTVIRRDPTSGGQWNVGKICSETSTEALGLSAQKPSDSDSLSASKSKSSMTVQITNPGYVKFVNVPLQNTPDENSRPTSTLNQDSSTASRCSPSVFERQLAVDQGKGFWSRTFRHGRQESGDSNSTTGSNHAESSSEARFSGEQLRGAEAVVPSSNVTTQKGSKSKGYVFVSPWNGRCDFYVASSGKSLKCKHTLPPTPNDTMRESANISELRFNLPTAPPPPPVPTANRHRASKLLLLPTSKRMSLQQPVSAAAMAKATSSTECRPRADSDPERLDLSLGQERAGGGIRGKRAKLGKLIIEDEGMRMLDLVVACNMALWWRGYDKGLG